MSGDVGSTASGEPDAVELTVAQAWFVSDLIGAGEYPWSLAIIQPLISHLAADTVRDQLREELAALGVISPDGALDQRVARWVRTACAPLGETRPGSCFEARTVRGGEPGPGGRTDQLRTFVAQQEDMVLVVMRAGDLVTFTELAAVHPRTLASVLTAGLPGAAPAKFRQFALPTEDGARADERIRAGAPPGAVLAGLGLPDEARAVLMTMFAGPRSYVEISPGMVPDQTARIGIGVLDTAAGRVLVAPSRAPGGQWVSTFSPGTSAAVATAVARLAEEAQGAQATRPQTWGRPSRDGDERSIREREKEIR